MTVARKSMLLTLILAAVLLQPAFSDGNGKQDAEADGEDADGDAETADETGEEEDAGDLDFAVGGNWIELSLAGAAGANAAAIGARVTATAGGITQTREVGGGYGQGGAQSDLVVHFGLDTACYAEVTVRWPDEAQTTQTFTLPAGYAFSLAQGGVPVVEG